VRIVADENVEDATANALRAAGHEVVLVRDKYGMETDDSDIAVRAEDDDRAILTHDDDFLGLDSPHLPVLFMPNQSPAAARVVGAINRIAEYGIDVTNAELFVPDGWA
jgi:hypothetical protein